MLFTPFRPISKTKLVFTDHYSLKLVFKNIPMKPTKEVAVIKVIRWNTNKEGGWAAYTEMTTNNAKLEAIAEVTNIDADTMMKKIDNELNNIKFKVFGNAKEKNKVTVSKEIESLQKEKVELCRLNDTRRDNAFNDVLKEIDGKLATHLLQKQRQAFETELESIRNLKYTKGRSAAIFSLRTTIVGSKSSKQEATVLIDPKSKSEVTTPEDIKRVSLQYCVDLLTNRKPKEDYIEDIWLKDIVHLVRMEEICEDDIQELALNTFEKTYITLSKKTGSKYKFIMKGGPAVKAALFKLCQLVWQTEKQPQTWERSALVQLYKGKGPRSILDNMRHLHCKDEFPKFFGHLVFSASKDKMISNLTKYQIATKPGHRAQEHMFVLKSVIALYIMYDKAVILSMWDLSNFFDRKSLSDCLNELYKSNVHGKLYRLLLMMNKNTRISVQTPVGTTEECDTGEGVGQGTLEGALVSAVNLDSGVNEYFHDSEYKASYGKVTLQPILF